MSNTYFFKIIYLHNMNVMFKYYITISFIKALVFCVFNFSTREKKYQYEIYYENRF